MSPFTTRPLIVARRGVVTSGHYLATVAGFRILEQGGNAFDAAVAMGLCLNLVEPHNNGLGGEAPTLVYAAAEKRVYAISGLGWSPAALTLDWCRQQGVDIIPGDGYLPACVPAMLDTFALMLARFGTLSFAQVVAPAIELAEQGFAMFDTLQNTLRQAITKYPTTAELFAPDGHLPEIGELVRNPDWAAAVRLMCQAEARCGKGRVAGIEAARDAFYKGPIAEKILAFISQNPVEDATGHRFSGLLSAADFAEWHAALEEPIHYNYRGLDVYKCSSWTQGPAFLQQLALLEEYDLKSLGHNSADYLHLVTEAAKLAFADREAYYGDPLFDDVPFDTLLSAAYNAGRRDQIDIAAASPDMRPGDAGRGLPGYVLRSVLEDNRLGLGFTSPHDGTRQNAPGDTTHLDAADAAGNLIACTPSGGWIQSSPVIPGLGFPLGTRGQMFYLNPDRPNALQPHKRPRATLTPTLVMCAGRPSLGFGTQGGDMQDQWTLQFFLNVVDFGMNLQEALDAPTVHSEHFPSSFYPRQAFPQRLSVEGRIPEAVRAELARRGHEIVVPGDWVHGRVLAVAFNAAQGTLSAGASPRQSITCALGW
ncbi:MAG: gamma-glutamyltransferase family protein [Chloroflexota bacterium]